MCPHIDLIVLPIPERKVLFVDQIYYQDNCKDIDSLCLRLGFSLERVDNDYSKPSWPCNSLIVKRNGDIFALTNSVGNEQFMSKLSDYGITPLGVPFSANCSEGGSIHCSTNTCPLNKVSFVENLCEVFSSC